MRTFSFLASTLLASAVLAASNGALTILFMNVAGLPAILNSHDVTGDKADNSDHIGAYFAEYGYDIIHVQEDFNHHAYIYATDNHTYRTATSGGVSFGSGLDALASYLWDETAIARVRWSD